MIDENFLLNTNTKSESSYQIPSARTINGAPSGEKMSSFLFCKKISLSRKWRVIVKTVKLNTTWRSQFKLTYGHSESWQYHSWSWKQKLYALLAIMSPMRVETHSYRRHNAWPFIPGSLCKLHLHSCRLMQLGLPCFNTILSNGCAIFTRCYSSSRNSFVEHLLSLGYWPFASSSFFNDVFCFSCLYELYCLK